LEEKKIFASGWKNVRKIDILDYFWFGGGAQINPGKMDVN